MAFTKSAAVDDYIARQPRQVQPILRRIRQAIRRAAPGAEEIISYQIPAYRMKGVLVWFSAAKKHIGFFPPVRGDAKLINAAARYAGEKGSLRFAYDKPVPYGLIARIVKHRITLDAKRAAAKKKMQK